MEKKRRENAFRRFLFLTFFRSVVKMFVCNESTVNHSFVHLCFCIHRSVSCATYFPFPHLFESMRSELYCLLLPLRAHFTAGCRFNMFYFNLVKYYGYGLACFFFIILPTRLTWLNNPLHSVELQPRTTAK